MTIALYLQLDLTDNSTLSQVCSVIIVPVLVRYVEWQKSGESISGLTLNFSVLLRELVVVDQTVSIQMAHHICIMALTT